MPTVAEIARITVRGGAVWRPCTACGLLAPLPPDVEQCRACRPDLHEPSDVRRPGAVRGWSR